MLWLRFTYVDCQLLFTCAAALRVQRIRYERQVEHDVRLHQRRMAMAKRLLVVQVHAWRAVKYQPPVWAEAEEWFRTWGWTSADYLPGVTACDVKKSTWALNVRTARDWMMYATLHRTHVGWDKVEGGGSGPVSVRHDAPSSAYFGPILAATVGTVVSMMHTL